MVCAGAMLPVNELTQRALLRPFADPAHSRDAPFDESQFSRLRMLRHKYDERCGGGMQCKVILGRQSLQPVTEHCRSGSPVPNRQGSGGQHAPTKSWQLVLTTGALHEQEWAVTEGGEERRGGEKGNAREAMAGVCTVVSFTKAKRGLRPSRLESVASLGVLAHAEEGGIGGTLDAAGVRRVRRRRRRRKRRSGRAS